MMWLIEKKKQETKKSEAEAKVAYAKTIPGQIRTQLQIRENKNTQTTGRN